MRAFWKKIEGFVLLGLAALFFWIPSYMQKPREANHKILVAAPQLDDSPFRKFVILVVDHNGYGAFGLVLNDPASVPGAPAVGGPVGGEDDYYTLHSLDVTGGLTKNLEEIDIGWTRGKAFMDTFSNRSKLPAEYIFFKGSAGWGMGQLQKEIERGAWKVIDFDRDLVFHTDPEKMYEAASAR